MKPRHRSAESGQYVDEKTADEHPDTTVAERPGRDALKAFDHAAEQLLDAAPLEGLAEHIATLRRLFVAELYP